MVINGNKLNEVLNSIYIVKFISDDNRIWIRFHVGNEKLGILIKTCRLGSVRFQALKKWEKDRQQLVKQLSKKGKKK